MFLVATGSFREKVYLPTVQLKGFRVKIRKVRDGFRGRVGTRESDDIDWKE